MNHSTPTSAPRLAYAAAHVVLRADCDPDPAATGSALLPLIDWDRTLDFRRHLWSLGLGVAEAMDTAQRSQLGWEVAAELLDRTLAESRRGGFPWTGVVGGAGTDPLSARLARDPAAVPSLDEIIAEYLRQADFIQQRGGTVMLLASPLMPKFFPRPEDYTAVYSAVASRLRPPVFLHWLGEMFMPELRGYFPGDSFLEIMDANREVIKGVKLSLLDDEREKRTRLRLARNGQIVLTGDDYHYAGLIVGDGTGFNSPTGAGIEVAGRRAPVGDFSHALLGIFDPIAPAAARALDLLASGDPDAARDLLASTEPLARVIFEPPVQYYKAGVVFIAWLNGRQDSFRMVGGMERMRDRAHYQRVHDLALACGLLENPPLARQRLSTLMKGDLSPK